MSAGIRNPSAGDRAPAGPRRLLTVAEAAAALGLSVYSVRRLVWDGHLPAVRLTRRVHVDVRDVDALIARAKDRTGAGSPLAAGPPPSRPA